MNKISWCSEIYLGDNTTKIFFTVNNINYEGIVPKSIIGELFINDNIEPYRNTIIFWKELRKEYEKLKKAKKKGGVKIYYQDLFYNKKQLTLEDIYKSIKF